MFEGISPLHLLVVLIIALVVLGPGKLPEVGAALGQGIREFRKATTDIREATRLDPPTPGPSDAALAPSIGTSAVTAGSERASDPEPIEPKSTG